MKARYHWLCLTSYDTPFPTPFTIHWSFFFNPVYKFLSFLIISLGLLQINCGGCITLSLTHGFQTHWAPYSEDVWTDWRPAAKFKHTDRGSCVVTFHCFQQRNHLRRESRPNMHFKIIPPLDVSLANYHFLILYISPLSWYIMVVRRSLSFMEKVSKISGLVIL